MKALNSAPGDGEDEVGEVPRRQEHHQQVEGALHELAPEDHQRRRVGHHAHGGHGEAAGAVQPVLEAVKNVKSNFKNLGY